MCGIIGSFNQKINTTTLDCLIHRGPDQQSIYNFKNLSVGHVRLSIIDLSEAGLQPMHSESKRFTIIFNGEIYNHEDLKKKLSKKKFNGHSDTETILHYLEEYGNDSVRDFNGIYSLALLDRKLNKISLVRDPFGVKPLYYAKTNNKVHSFSSELKPIFNLGFKKEFNEKLLTTYLKLRYIPSPFTFFKNVYKLEPGNIIEISLETQEIICQRSFSNVPAIDKNISKNEAFEEYDYLLRKAVKRQLMSDVPLSLLLSGGVDSALLAKLTYEVSNKKVKTYTAGYNISDNNIDELDDAQKTAKTLGLENEKVILSEEGFIKDLPNLISAIEEPLGSQSIYPINFLAKKISQDGIKVALTGQGVDEPWGGYNRYNWQQLFEKISKYEISGFSRLSKKTNNDSLRRALNSLSTKDRAERFIQSYSLFDNSMINKILKREVNAELNTKQILENKMQKIGLGDRDSVEAMMVLDARMNLSDDLLLYTDKISMQHSVEMRVPFLDIELMGFVESLPCQLKVGMFKNKYLHKKLSEKYLPKEIINRKKRGFYTPRREWFKSSVGVQLENMIINHNGLFNMYFDNEKISDMFHSHRLGKVNYEKQLYLIVVLFFWMRDNFN